MNRDMKVEAAGFAVIALMLASVVYVGQPSAAVSLERPEPVAAPVWTAAAALDNAPVLVSPADTASDTVELAPVYITAARPVARCAAGARFLGRDLVQGRGQVRGFCP